MDVLKIGVVRHIILFHVQRPPWKSCGPGILTAMCRSNRAYDPELRMGSQD